MKQLRHKSEIMNHLDLAVSYLKEQSGWDPETKQLERVITSIINKTEGKQ